MGTSVDEGSEGGETASKEAKEIIIPDEDPKKE